MGTESLGAHPLCVCTGKCAVSLSTYFGTYLLCNISIEDLRVAMCLQMDLATIMASAPDGHKRTRTRDNREQQESSGRAKAECAWPVLTAKRNKADSGSNENSH
eukprot:2600593-Pyramimonas_sp.AAC.2